jgi:hypothetical protein
MIRTFPARDGGPARGRDYRVGSRQNSGAAALATDETSSSKSSDPLGEPVSSPPPALADSDNQPDNLNPKKPEVETPAKPDSPAGNLRPEVETSATKAHWVPTPHWKERLDLFNKGL